MDINSLSDLGLTAAPVTALMVLYMLFILISLGVSLVFAVMRAVGIYEMSVTAGLKNPWYSFVPFFSVFAIGRLGDRCVSEKPGKRTHFSKPMLVLYILIFVITVIMLGFMFSALIGLIFEADHAYSTGSDLDIKALLSFLPVGVFAMALSAISIVYVVFYYISLWRIYNYFDDCNAVAYLVVSIIFSFMAPIFLFLIRKNKPLPPSDNYTQGGFTDFRTE